jgi:alkaline phosphatase D
VGFRRRDFMKWGLAQAVIVGGASRAKGQNESEEKVAKAPLRTGPSILQGATDDSKTQFSILQDATAIYDISVTDLKGRIWTADKMEPVTFEKHPKKLVKIYFSNLYPNEIFYLVLRDSATQKLVDVREFSTLDLNKVSLKFALCSCMKDNFHEPAIWKNMVLEKPDILFFVGDAVYADKGSTGKHGADPAHLWKKFCDARNTLEIYYSHQLIPILATWDDHDFGLNDGNCRDYPYVKESQWNFLQFFAQEESHCRLLKRGPGVSSAFQFRDQLFLLMDNRTFREKNGSTDRYAHWGKDQELWMLDLMRQNSGSTWIMTGSQVFPSLPLKASLSRDHKAQYAGVMRELKTIPSKAIFVSGDVHYTEISLVDPQDIGYRTYELTSSSVHSNGIPGAPTVMPNSRRMQGTGVGARNYILVEAQSQGHGSVFTATAYGVDGKAHFHRVLEV